VINSSIVVVVVNLLI